jgi:transposase, IS5 family
VLRTTNLRPTLWEELLPAACRSMPAELEAVDQLLDDERFFAPYRRHFDPGFGRPSIPIETYLRMMWLKFRYGLGFESLCREVSDSLAWRRFCRIPLGEPVPHPTTLMKITKRCGPGTIAALNETLLAKAREAKVVKLDRVRADTTVVEANVAYPTDSGLLARGVARMARLTRRLKGLGLAARTHSRDRTRSMRRRAHAIGAWLRRRTETAKDEVYAITGEMAVVAEAAVVDARAVVRNARRALRRTGSEVSGAARAAVAELDKLAALVERIATQTRTRLAGDTPPGATRVVSLHDPDAGPIVKGRLGRPVEYGYLAQVVDNREGIVLDHSVHIGNPPDAPLLAPAIGRVIQRFGRAPRAVTADRGYGEAAVEADLGAAGVGFVAIPRKGRPGAARQIVERSPRFRRLVKWRTGAEGRISHLKHGYGWTRTLFDGIDGAETWCGFGILAHNAVKIAGLIDEPNRRPSARRKRSEHPLGARPTHLAPDPNPTAPPPDRPPSGPPRLKSGNRRKQRPKRATRTREPPTNTRPHTLKPTHTAGGTDFFGPK